MKNTKKSLTSIATLITTSLVYLTAAAHQAYAEGITNPVIGNLGKASDKGKEGTLFLNYAVTLWRVAINLGVFAVFGMYIWGAYEWLASGSDTKGAEKGRSRIINATIGLIILVSTFTIIGFVGNLLFQDEFNILELTFPRPGS